VKFRRLQRISRRRDFPTSSTKISLPSSPKEYPGKVMLHTVPLNPFQADTSCSYSAKLPTFLGKVLKDPPQFKIMTSSQESVQVPSDSLNSLLCLVDAPQEKVTQVLHEVPQIRKDNATREHHGSAFHPFPLLPPEIRLRIWSIALTAPQIHILTTSHHPNLSRSSQSSARARATLIPNPHRPRTESQLQHPLHQPLHLHNLPTSRALYPNACQILLH
jgi:hypothetical protein